MKEFLINLGEVIENADLENYNTYKIKKKAKILFLPKDIDSLKEALNYLKENNLKYIIIGNGSNIIFSDNYFDGIVIKLSSFNKIEINENMVTCGAGVMLPTLVMETINNNLKGLEWAFGIPGNIGGSIAGNAGAYNSFIFEFIDSITIINELNDIVTLNRNDLKYGYRTSMFKENRKWIIISCTLKLLPGKKESSLAIINDRLERRRESQPLEYPSAGSVFRNPEDNFAGKLIEDLGFKNTNIGGAYVSEKHANFIINKGNATGCDIRKLIELIKSKVKENYDIELIVEQEFVDW